VLTPAQPGHHDPEHEALTVLAVSRRSALGGGLAIAAVMLIKSNDSRCSRDEQADAEAEVSGSWRHPSSTRRPAARHARCLLRAAQSRPSPPSWSRRHGPGSAGRRRCDDDHTEAVSAPLKALSVQLRLHCADILHVSNALLVQLQPRRPRLTHRLGVEQADDVLLQRRHVLLAPADVDALQRHVSAV
jgi:hypothetical protein